MTDCNLQLEGCQYLKKVAGSKERALTVHPHFVAPPFQCDTSFWILESEKDEYVTEHSAC